MTKKTALVLIEYQREWLDRAGKLRFLLQDPEQFDLSVERSKVALKLARDAGMLIAHVGLHFSADHRELGGLGSAQFGLRAVIPRAGTFRMSEGGDVHVEPFLARGQNEIEIRGRTGASGFTGSNLNAYLRNNGVEHIYLMGYALHVCVLATLVDGHERGFDVSVLEECTSAFNPEQRKFTLEEVVHHFGEHISNQEFARRLGVAS